VRLENGLRPNPTGATPNPPVPRGRRLEGNRIQRGVGSPRCGRAGGGGQARSTGLGGTWGAQGGQGAFNGGIWAPIGLPMNAPLSPPISWCSI
jgi:hypothetical protein